MEGYKGQVHIYTGDGKGKTTAALGLILRAVGAGWKALLVQFLKKGEFSEVKGLRMLGDRVDILQFGTGMFVRGKPSALDISNAENGLSRTGELLATGAYDLVVLDEINVAVRMGLVDEDAVLELIAARPDDVELILTGRGATDGLQARADLVTECRMIKHYYQKGLGARLGIEK